MIMIVVTRIYNQIVRDCWLRVNRRFGSYADD